MNLKPQIPNFRSTSNVEHQTSNFKLAAALLVGFFLIGCTDSRSSKSTDKSMDAEPPIRIISLAPSITEVLFVLGLGDRVVGVTRYCDYPPEALGKDRVGGYFDVNYEAVLALEPDIVIHLTEHEDARYHLKDLGIKTLAVNHSRVKGILQSITTIGDRCGAQEEGKTLRHLLESRIREIQEILVSVSPNHPVPTSEDNTSGIYASPRPRVIVTVGRSLQTGETGEIYVSGRDGFYDDLINLAGGENAYREETLKFPALSAEGLANMDPDVIIEMIPDLQSQDDLDRLMSYWEKLPGLSAVREGRVHILGGDYVVVPGPRYIRLLEEMAEIIHGVKLENGEWRSFRFLR